MVLPLWRWGGGRPSWPHGKKLLPQPLITRASQYQLFLWPFLLPLLPPRSSLHHLPSSPARHLPCGYLRVSPSQAGFDHVSSCFPGLPDFLDKPKPCGLIWGPMAETAMCSSNLLPFPPVDIAGLHFPAAPAVRRGHMTDFTSGQWSMSGGRHISPSWAPPKSPARSSTLSFPLHILARCRASSKGI